MAVCTLVWGLYYHGNSKVFLLVGLWVYSDVIATVVIDTHLATMLIYLVAISYRIAFPAQASLRVGIHCVDASSTIITPRPLSCAHLSARG